MEARENLDPALVAVVEDEIENEAIVSNIAVSQTYVGVSVDRERRLIVYSLCYVPDADGPWTNDTGWRLWSGISGLNNGAVIDPFNYKSFQIMTRSLDDDTVTRYDCWSSTSTVPNGIGGSNGTARRMVEADYGTIQIPKLVDPRTGNVWSHHISVGARSCLIYEFRRSEDFKQTISPYVPSADRHLELLGITEDWVYIGDMGKDTPSTYTLELLPRVRTSDETAADYLLSYASFEFPETNNYNFRSAVSSDGSLYLFGSTGSIGVARTYKLYKFTQPTSAPFGGPVVGGGWTNVTPWSASDGPNTDAAAYRFASSIFQNSNILAYQPASNTLVCISKLMPAQKYPTPTNDPNDLAFDCTYIDLSDLSFGYHPAFVTGYMTAAWTTTSDPDEAAWAVLDCQEHDGDLAYHDYEFESVDYERRWFSFMVLPVVGGVIQGSYAAANPLHSASYRILVEYQFVPGSAPVVTRIYREEGWDLTYAAYGAAISHPEVVNYSMAGFDPNYGNLYDIGLWDEDTLSWWWSGNNGDFQQNFDADFAARFPYVDECTVFLRLSLNRNRGVCRIRYGDLWG